MKCLIQYVCIKRSVEAIKYFPEQPLPYALAGVSCDAERI